MVKKQVKFTTLTKHRIHLLNEDFENIVKMKKLKKSHKHKDYFTY